MSDWLTDEGGAAIYADAIIITYLEGGSECVVFCEFIYFIRDEKGNYKHLNIL